MRASKAKKTEKAMDETENRIESTVESTLEELEKFAGDIGQSATKTLRKGRKLVQNHPVEACLVGFGLGVATALLVSKASSSAFSRYEA